MSIRKLRIETENLILIITKYKTYDLAQYSHEPNTFRQRQQQQLINNKNWSDWGYVQVDKGFYGVHVIMLVLSNFDLNVKNLFSDHDILKFASKLLRQLFVYILKT